MSALRICIGLLAASGGTIGKWRAAVRMSTISWHTGPSCVTQSAGSCFRRSTETE